MHSFKNDYSEGAHPDILDALLRNNNRQEEGYGLDQHTLNATSLIKKLVGDSDAAVHLISGGTQTNLIAIGAFLRPHEACITVKTGHIATHETGAIEATGHKLLTVDGVDGKLTPQLIAPVLTEHHFEHMVKPRLVYISNPSELGTIYTKDELSLLSDYCRKNDLFFYIDGARLGSALVCQESALTLEDVYSLADAFFIGGTKIGALLGEALVVRNPALKSDLRYLIKQRGALLAKGRILGIQFEELFRDNLYFNLAKHANDMAQYMVAELTDSGCTFLINSPTNQIFPVMENTVIDELSQQFDFYIWAKIDENNSAIRLVTSWATGQKEVESFVDAYKTTSVIHA
ncbi:MAG: threonine aldolase [Desulfobulbaceae bacterium]|nr:threonine aldolase [Desulfobulbaceae bacterium]